MSITFSITITKKRAGYIFYSNKGIILNNTILFCFSVLRFLRNDKMTAES